MALKYLGILALVLTVTSVRGQANCNRPVEKVFSGCISQVNQMSSTGTICSAGNMASVIASCSGECSDLLRTNSYYKGQLTNALKSAQVACENRMDRACGITEMLTCTLAVISFSQNVGTVGSTNVNDAEAVCGYVTQYAGDINICQGLINDCVALGDPNSATITNTIKEVTGYVLITTGQSCKCIQKTAALITNFNRATKPYNCSVAQIELSELVDTTIGCTNALPRNPFPGFEVFNADFRVASESMIRSGASGFVTACALKFVPTATSVAALTATLSTLLFMASMAFHYLRPYNH